MKMGRFEKLFVNRTGHAESVAGQQMALLESAGVAPGARYLDVGCGNGLATLELARRLDLAATGVDVDPEQIRLAKEYARGGENATFLRVEGTTLLFDDGYFDIVATFNTTHHIPRWQDALIEMARVLRSGGLFVYRDFVLPSWVARIGEPVLGKYAGFPTRSGFTYVAESQGLSEQYWRTSGMRCDAILRKLER